MIKESPLFQLLRQIEELKTETLDHRGKGIYFLISQNELVYIGATINGLSRIIQHKWTKEFDSFKFLSLEDYSAEEIESLETVLIAFLKPRLNTQTLPKGLSMLVTVIDRL